MWPATGVNLMQIYQRLTTGMCDATQVWIGCRSIKGLPLACVMQHRYELDADLSKAYHWHVWCDTGMNRMQIYQRLTTGMCDVTQVWTGCRSIKGLPLACVMQHRCESDADLSKAYHWHVWCDTGVNWKQIYQRLTTGVCDVPQVWIWCWETRATLDWNTTPTAMQHPNQINQCMHKQENQMLRRLTNSNKESQLTLKM